MKEGLLGLEPGLSPSNPFQEVAPIVRESRPDSRTASEVDIAEAVANWVEKEDFSKVIKLLNQDPDCGNALALRLIEAGKANNVGDNIDKFKKLEQAVALKLIEAGRGMMVLKFLENFQGVDYKEIGYALIEAKMGLWLGYYIDRFPEGVHKEIALKLIEAGAGGAVAYHLENFTGLDHKDMALRLIKAGQAEAVAGCLDKFRDLDHNEIAQELLESGKGNILLGNLSNFRNLNASVAYDLIWNQHGGTQVVKFLDSFQGLDNQEAALKMIDMGAGDAVAKHLDKFKGLDYRQVAQKLIQEGRGEAVAKHLDKFKGVDHKEIAIKLIESGAGNWLMGHFEKFQGLDQKQTFAKILEKPGNFPAVYKYLSKFHDLDKADALKLCDSKDAYVRSEVQKYHSVHEEGYNTPEQEENLHKSIAAKYDLTGFIGCFEPSIHKDIALKFIESGVDKWVLANMDKIQGRDQAFTLELIEKGHGELVIENADRFQPLDQAIALKLIEKGFAPGVLRNLEKFNGVDHKKIAYKLIEIKKPHYIFNFFEKFQGLDRGVALKLIEEGFDRGVALHIGEFQELDPQEIALKLIERGDLDSIARSLENFPGLNHKELALKMIRSRSSIEFCNTIKKFQGLDAEVALVAINARQGETVARNIEVFQGLDQYEIALELIRNKQEGCFFENFEKFRQVDRKQLALRLIGLGMGSSIIKNLEKFPDLDSSIGLSLKYSGEKFDARPEMTPDGDSPRWLRDTWDLYDDQSIPLKIRHSNENRLAVRDSLLSKVQGERLPQALLGRITHRISPQELLLIQNDKPESLAITAKVYDAESLSSLFENDSRLIEDEEIRAALTAGREVFGAKVMMEYMNRADMTRHDALFFMPQVIALYRKSGLDKQTFANSILLQVAKDQAAYDCGTAHHEFAKIVESLDKEDFDEVLTDARRYGKISKLNELAEELKDADKVFRSWKSLKKFHELANLLKRKDLLEQLNDPNLSPKMRAFVENLAFHPNISMGKVMQFWREPAKFLDIEDVHSGAEVNAVKKPANYLSLPYLGLKAEDLRDAYVEGALDDLQTLPPMERVYKNVGLEVGVDPDAPEGLYKYLIQALGQEREGKKGLAKRPKKLFDETKRFCRTHGLDFKKLLFSSEVVASLGVDRLHELKDIIFDQLNGLDEPEGGDTYRVRIGRKSDPEMTVAGNDTASCMPFGSGKNNVYMFNPNCNQLVVERQAVAGKWRTVAQSVLTIDGKMAKETPNLIAGYKQHQPLKELIDARDFSNLSVVTCDNIEIAKNEEGKRSQNIRLAYERFFCEYLETNAVELEVDASRVVVGKGYTPQGLGLKQETNHYVPQAPMGYSDNEHQNCFILETGLKPGQLAEPKFIAPLTVRDSLAAAWVEGKAYADNMNLMEYLHKVQNNIIGMQIANRFFERPNLSFITRGQGNVPTGYMIAYQGVENGKDMVYISDLAADPENKMAGAILVRQFLRSYFENYGTENRAYIPIFTNAREKTSYQWILKLAEAEAKRHGAKVELFEAGTYKAGQDTMHNIYILIGKDEKEIKQQKASLSRK